MPQGFFSKKETESSSSTKGKIHSCASCGLYKNCHSAKMKPYGRFKKGIMILGRSPGKAEDRAGKPWHGKAGELLKRQLKRVGIDLFEDCVNLNAVNCHTPKNRNPTIREINHCRSIRVRPALKKYKPNVIITLGKIGLQSLIGHRWQKGLGMSKWQGQIIPDQKLNAWICPTFHPKYLLHRSSPRDMMKIWLDDLKRATDKISDPVPEYKNPKIIVKKDLHFLNDWPKHQLSAFDYETTGLKPHDKGHRIVSCSMTYCDDKVWVFKMPSKKQEAQPLRHWLADPKIPKAAHNMKFEEQWSKNILKTPVRNWAWDSMVASHVLNNQPGLTGLKIQSYFNFGIMGYEKGVGPYLKSTTSNAGGDNAKNRIKKLMKSKKGLQDLLKYNALDSAYELWLAKKQMEKLNHQL
jgi:uracil-DNA glycosylase family 4